MRCLGCNKALTEFESTRRYQETEEFIDLCNDCFRTTEIKATERPDLMSIADICELDDVDSEENP